MAESKACNELPIAVTEHYTSKGQWSEFNNLKTYTSGPENATKGLLIIYDIFGFTPQIFQGADIFASAGYQVIMPDFFEGDHARAEWFPQTTPEQKTLLSTFRAGPASIPTSLPRITPLLSTLQSAYPSIKSWYAIGYCWGGKLVALASGPETPFSAAIQTSPGRLDVKDAESVRIPMAVLASKDEDGDVVEKYRDVLGMKGHVEVFGGMVHGWMSARADLADEVVKKEYERGYRVALDFLAGVA